jgi:hypothetical protein
MNWNCESAGLRVYGLAGLRVRGCHLSKSDMCTLYTAFMYSVYHCTAAARAPVLYITKVRPRGELTIGQAIIISCG